MAAVGFALFAVCKCMHACICMCECTSVDIGNYSSITLYTSSFLSIFLNSVGSAVLLRASLSIISDLIRFQNNRANQGAALKILDGSRVRSLEVFMCVEVEELKFLNNSYLLALSCTYVANRVAFQANLP